jgi:tetratricopeptide (TPR) repeat protein
LTEASQPADLPSRIGKYEIVSRVGRGAMGVVYHARDPFLERDVALKVMLPQIAGDPDQKGRFEREARAVAKIVHPNVLTVFDLGYHHDGSPYIAMELLKGQDLLHALRHQPALSLERKADIIIQLLDGLGCAHQAGIVHRDVKPANIFLCQDGTVKIMDFGVARFTKSSTTGTGAVMGTADYMSPEQVQGAKVDGRTDLWSAGCVLYQLLTGHRPFTGESLMTVFYKITHTSPALELPASPEFQALVPIVTRALARNAEERYQTAAEFADALRAFRKAHALLVPQVAAPPPPGPAEAPPAAAAVADDLLDALVGEARPAVTPTIGLPMPEPPVPAAPEAPAPAAAPPAADTAQPMPAVPPAPPPDPTPLFRTMRDIFVGAKSGHLHFTHGNERRSLNFVRGLILYGSSDVEGEHLGNTLVRYGLLSQEDLERATPAVLRDRKRLGQVVQELGIMERSRLDEAVALHVRDLLFTVLDRGAGAFGFEEMASDDDAGIVAQIRPGQMILEAARRLQSPEVMKQVLGDLDRPLGMSSHPLLGVQKLKLSPIDGFLLSRIDGVMSAREIFQITPLPEEDTERSLFALLCTGTVEYVPKTATWRARAAAQAARQQPAPTPGPPPPAPSAPPPPAAPAAASAPAPPAPSSTPAPSPTRKTDPGRSPKEEVAREEAARKSLDDRRREILEAFEGLQGRDHFELLGIERKATESEVKEAYFRLARRFHPDTPLDPALADLRPRRENVFLRLAAAYETLRNPQSRAQYERMVEPRSPRRHVEVPAASAPAAPAPPPPPDPAEQEAAEERRRATANEAVPNAMWLIKEEKYWDAIQALEPALPYLEGSARLKASVLLARAYLKNPNWIRQAESTLREVLREKPDLAEAHVVLGLVYRATNLRSRALASYRRALELDPRNEEAHAEIAALGPDEAPPPSSLRNKLFGKR